MNCICTSSIWGRGGAFYLIIQDSSSKFIASGQVEFINCTCAYTGGAIWADINAGELILSNIYIENCYGTSGGAIYLNIKGGGQVTINGTSQISNCTSTVGFGGGIYSYVQSTNSQFIISGQLSIKNCIGKTFGGGIYAEIPNGNMILSGLNITDCQSQNGAGIYSVITQYGTLTIIETNLIQNCSNTNGYGGGIYIQIQDSTSQCIISGSLIIKDCNSLTTGGGIQANIRYGELTISGISIDNCRSQLGGGGLNSSLSAGGRLTIKDQSVFQNCQSTLGSGGGMYSYIDNGKLNLDNVSFIECSCIQNGGALYIAVQLAFEGNSAAGMGQNIHLQSIIRFQTGLKISQNSLLTVIDTTNLYTSPYYAYDYMEIDQNDEERNPGTNSYDQHIPLFEQSFTSNFINPSYIDANNGIDDLKYCGRIRFSCKRISYAIDRGNGSLTNTNYVLILLSDYTSDSNIQINIPTTYWNYITIQSDGYTQDAQLITNPKYLIPTSSQINSLFTITANGHLDLIGLRFSNINPTSLNPLFSIQSPDLDNIPILSIFDCEFNQDPTSYPDNSLSHCLIFINGGKLTISRTIIKDYQLSNGKSSIMIYSDISSTSEVYRMNQIDIINSTFENIKQNEGSRSGSAINAELNSGSIMNISQSCTFTNCISGTTGGAIQIILSGGQVDLNEVIIKGCKARNGGGIYINIDFSDQFEFKINNTVVQECETKADPSSTYPTGYGGGIFLIGSGDYDLSTKGLDLKGMKIYNNSADKGGQSLYVVMTNLIEWCKSGIAGEYVKGNYSDRFSNFEDIEGISVNSTTFDTLSLEQIQQRIFTGIDGKEDQAYPLEVIIEKADIGKTTHFPWWIILIIIQISDPSKDIDPPLKKNFDLYFEQEQSHNSSNEQQQQQTTIHWNSFKKNDIPSSAGAIQKK
ncbi:MAG: hypothetical protein EZS28_006879 [Streblomastix strix]|uniref:Uncharacterized protein n=1 Tax=Streblomastix strix TaxID=222440 RepID=A0A5J4WSV8_9EUKA|nr:MAG: hypothetical protein EZS28_006879 [Streblomastix strix]